MINTRTRSIAACAAAAAALWSLSTLAYSEGAPAKAARSDQSTSDECASALATQDTQMCQREVARARAAGKRGQLVTPDADTMLANQLARCDRHPAESRATCVRMVRGEGTRSGTVAEGGVLKSLTEIVPGTSEQPSADAAPTK